MSWLSYLGYEVYTPLFLSAGYDLATVSRVTPEDLTAVGIQLPAHRHRIMSAVAKLDVSDGLPDFVPSSLGEWLRLIRLESYHGSLVAQGYSTIHQVLRVSVEDLEDIGFYKLGHQKRLLLAIKKVKELQQGEVDSGRIRHLTMNSPRLSRISLSTFQSPEPEPEPSVTMPKPMEPLHNPMYMNSLAPYIDSLALPSHSLPPRSRPVHGGKPGELWQLFPSVPLSLPLCSGQGVRHQQDQLQPGGTGAASQLHLHPHHQAGRQGDEGDEQVREQPGSGWAEQTENQVGLEIHSAGWSVLI